MGKRIEITNVNQRVTDRNIHSDRPHELKKSSQLLQPREDRLKTILDNTPDAILILNQQGEIENFYQTAQEMFLYSEAEISGKPFSTLLPFPYSQQYDSFFVKDATQATIGFASREASALRSNGDLFPAEMTIRQIEEGDGLKYVVTIVDMTDQKKVQDALFQAKELAQVTLSSIADGVISTDIIGRIKYANPAALRLIERELDDVIGLDIDLVVTIESEHQRLPVYECLEKGVQIESLSGDLLMVENGRSLVIHQVASPIRNRVSEIIGAVMIFRDMSKSHQLANRLSWQASHDDLTRLYNRRELEHKLQQAMDSAISGNIEHCLVYMDLDKFKVVNDTCGHAAGDELLKQIAEIFKANLRGADTLARLGGDEFAFILTRCDLPQAYHYCRENPPRSGRISLWLG